MFITQNYRTIASDEGDVDDIAAIYNSNTDFFVSHIDVKKVGRQWCLQEYHDMKESGFSRYKIMDNENNVRFQSKKEPVESSTCPFFIE